MTTFTYKDYSGTVEESVEDKCFRGKLLDIRGLVTYEADTLIALHRAFKDAVDDYRARSMKK